MVSTFGLKKILCKINVKKMQFSCIHKAYAVWLKYGEWYRMIYPSIDKLLNIVSSKYELVHIMAIRSKQMHEYGNYQMESNEYRSAKNLGKAMEELEKGLIKVIKTED